MDAPSLFDLVDPSLSPTDPRNRPHMAEQEEEGPEYVTDVAELKRIWLEVVRSAFPPNPEQYAHCRWRKQEVEFVITGPPDPQGGRPGLLGTVTPHNWGVMVTRSLDKSILGTFAAALAQTQSNGTWLPTRCEIRESVSPRNDRKGPYRGHDVKPAGADSGVTMMEGRTWDTVVPIPVKVLEGVIIWTDIANREDMKYDDRGNLITKQDLRVSTATSPELVNALARQGEAMAKIAESLSVAATPSEAAPTPKQRDLTKVIEANRRRGEMIRARKKAATEPTGG